MNLVEACELKLSCLSDLLIYSQNQTVWQQFRYKYRLSKHAIRDLLTLSQLYVLYGEAEAHVPRGGLRKYMKYTKTETEL